MSKITERRKFRKRVPFKPTVLPAQLGDGGGVVDVPGMSYHVYARVAGGAAQAVYNDRVPPINNLLVDVGNTIEDPRKFQVLGARSYNPGGVGSTPQTGYAPAIRYEWMAPGGGQDPLHVQLRQYMPLRHGPSSGMTIQLQPGLVYTPSGSVVNVASQTASMTAHIPATTGKAALVLITVNTSGTLVATKGTEYTLTDKTTPALVLAMLPAIPASTIYVCGAVRVYNGQTAVTEGRISSDIIDLRDSGINSTMSSITAHASTHISTGSDPIAAAVAGGASGLLTGADKTKLDGVTNASNLTSGTLDGDRLPALSATKRGGVPATGTPSNLFLRDDGTWTSPAGSGDVVGPASATDGHLAVFDGITGKLLKDGGAATAGSGDVVGPASATDGHLAVFDGTTGKLVKDGGAVPTQIYRNSLTLFIYEGIPTAGSFSIGALTVSTGQPYNFYCTSVTTPADGDELSFTTLLRAGTYTISEIGVKNTTRAKLDWYMDGSTFTTGQDWYAASATQNTVFTQTGVTVTGSGEHTVKCKVNGRNASASGWLMSLTCITLLRTGA